VFQRVRVRITILTVSLLLVLYTVTSVAVYTIVQRAVMRQIDTMLTVLSHTVVQQGIDYTELQLPSDVYALVNSNGLPATIATPMPEDLQQALLSLAQSEKRSHGIVNLNAARSSYRVLFIIRKSDDNNKAPHFLILAANDEHENSVLARLKSVLWFVGIFGSVGATLAGFYLADRVLRPIRKAWERQLEFVSNASHELRTPLAVIQSNLGIVMEHTDQNVVDNLEWLNNAHSESRRLVKLVKDLLTLARADSEKSPIEKQDVNVSALALRVCELYQPIANMGDIHLSVQASDEAYVSGDSDRLHQLLVILLDNACKFTPKDGQITVNVEQSRTSVLLSVVDTGEGIAPEDLPRVFDRFYTGDKSRTKLDQSGTGLGLSIAKWIVEAHGGKIGISSKGAGLGTTVKIELPISNANS
jgi:two-component system, OmpR family, sensor histidine kinase CiaH